MEADLELITKQTNCDIKKAKQFYKKHSNNITDAILDILGLYKETKIKNTEEAKNNDHKNILELRNIENNRKKYEKKTFVKD
tara:strand:- start:78 stop:323 length:246 start_codon:yes stop_codon:yes gene_type:complete